VRFIASITLQHHQQRYTLITTRHNDFTEIAPFHYIYRVYWTTTIC